MHHVTEWAWNKGLSFQALSGELATLLMFFLSFLGLSTSYERPKEIRIFEHGEVLQYMKLWASIISIPRRTLELISKSN